MSTMISAAGLQQVNALYEPTGAPSFVRPIVAWYHADGGAAKPYVLVPSTGALEQADTLRDFRGLTTPTPRASRDAFQNARPRKASAFVLLCDEAGHVQLLNRFLVEAAYDGRPHHHPEDVGPLTAVVTSSGTTYYVPLEVSAVHALLNGENE